jgi:hypothetical protein
MSVGCTSNDYIVSFIECNSFNIPHLYAYGHWSKTETRNDSSQGVYISKCYGGFLQLQTTSCKNNALLIDGIKNVEIKWLNLLSQNTGIIETINGYSNSASKIILHERYREGTPLTVNNIATDGGTNDGLFLEIYALNHSTTNSDNRDLIITDTSGNIEIKGRMQQVELPTNNTIRENAIVGTYTLGTPKNSFSKPIIDNWIDFTPSITWNTATPNSITTYARYKQIGKTIFCKIKLLSSDGNGCDGFVLTPPITAKNIFFNIIKPYSLILNNSDKRIETIEFNHSNNLLLQSYFANAVPSGSKMEIYLDFEYEIN